MKKKKRGESSAMRVIFPLIALVTLILIAIMTTFFVRTTVGNDFATEAWQDPHMICSTQWMNPEFDRDNPELMQVIAEHELPVDAITIIAELAMPACHSNNQSLERHTDIFVKYTGNDALVSDNEQMGQAIHDVIAALSSTEISQAWVDFDILSITFLADSINRRQWRMNWVQAVRAYNAGLTGLNLYELGNVR